jgi:NADH-quinone oxidoreductase subunit J
MLSTLFLRVQTSNLTQKTSNRFSSEIFTSPADHLLPAVFGMIALLSVPALEVVSRALENTISSTTAAGWNAFGELLLPLGAGISAGAVAAFRNPMHSLLALLCTFFCTALLYLIAGLAFVGVVFLIVYVGAVAVLFLFVIMLLNVKSLTSDEELVQHVSQIISIIFAALLLIQIVYSLGGAFDHLLAVGFLRDFVIEPTTGEAISYFVRYLARDINGLTKLYTLHGILLLIITAVLLVALLGAIILATVTTERATSISDLRQYERKLTPQMRVLFYPPLLAVLSTSESDIIFTWITISDLGPILFSFYLEEAARDADIRRVRKFKHDAYVSHTYKRSTRVRPFRKFLRARKVSFGRCAHTHFHAYKKTPEVAAEDVMNTSKRQFVPWNKKFRIFSVRENKAMRVYFARAALATILARPYRAVSKRRIVRRRWLWYWRRKRATWLRRMLIKRTKIPQNVPLKIKINLDYPRWPQRNPRLYEEAPFKDYYFQRIVLRLRPGLRVLGKRRIGLFQFLHALWVTKVYSRLFYWAWRTRAFCAYFISFMFLIPPVVTFLWLFVEEQNAAWATLVETHTFTAKILYEYTELKHLGMSYSNFAAAVLYVPALIWTITSQHPAALVYISLLFAWDAVTSHGGELSDDEFQESRCNYWRKHADDYPKGLDAAEEARTSKVSTDHPDKGRTDKLPWWETVVLPDAASWIPDLVTAPWMPEWLKFYIGGFFVILFNLTINPLFHLTKLLFVNVIVPIFGYLCRTFTYIGGSPAWRYFVDALTLVAGEIAKAFSMAWTALMSVLPEKTLFETFPFLADWCDLLRYWLSTAWAWFIDTVSLVWSYIKWGFDKVEYHPKLLEVIHHTRDTQKVVATMTAPIAVAIALYFIAVFALHFPWKRVYGKLVRRPPAYTHALAFIAAMYLIGIVERQIPFYFWDALEDPKYRYLSDYFFEAWQNASDFRIDYFIDETPYLSLAILGLIYTLLRPLRRRKIARARTYFNSAAGFRNYYNYRLRAMTWAHEGNLLRELSQEMSPFDSVEAAYKTISQEGRAETAAENAAAIAEGERMIWIRITYRPTFYDPHPNPKFGEQHPHHFAYVVENHYKNPHHHNG